MVNSRTLLVMRLMVDVVEAQGCHKAPKVFVIRIRGVDMNIMSFRDELLERENLRSRDAFVIILCTVNTTSVV